MDDMIMNIYEAEKPVKETPEEKFFADICNCRRLRVRKGPSLSADILTILDEGTKVEVFTEGDTFNEIVIPDSAIHGFVMNQFLGPVYIDTV